MNKIKTWILLLSGCWLIIQQAHGGTVSGVIATPSGRPIKNGTITFSLSHPAVLSGTATVAGNAACWTDKSGNVVGLPGDGALAAPVLSSNLGSGSLAAGIYYVRYTWANSTGESDPSSERAAPLNSTGTVILAAPTNVPANATSMKVYISTSSGTETLQGSVVVTNGMITGSYSQSSSLVSGSALPTGNTSQCQLYFNDQLMPSWTGYSVALSNSEGSLISGFPQHWYLSGGAHGTVDVSQGTTRSSGKKQSSRAIVSNPAANQMQSINGPINLNGFGVFNAIFPGPTPWSDITYYGAKCDDSTDDTTALQAAINAYCGSSTAGGAVFVPPSANGCKIAGQITMPNDGGTSPVANQQPCRIFGESHGGVADFPNGGGVQKSKCNGSTLDMTFNATTAKFLTLGNGKLEIDHICFKDTNTDATPFIFDTNTVMNVHDSQFLGNCTGSAFNPVFILGGSSTTVGNTTSAPFSGYGTKVINNEADCIGRFALLQTFANDIDIAYNHIFQNSVFNSGGAIELNPATDPVSGNKIIGNLIEVSGYKYGINLLKNATWNTIDANDCFDFIDGVTTSCVNVAASEGNFGNTVIDGSAGTPSQSPISGQSDALGLSSRNNYCTVHGVNVAGTGDFCALAARDAADHVLIDPPGSGTRFGGPIVIDSTSNIGMVRLQDVVLSSPAPDITFSSIPSTPYNSLRIEVQARGDGASAIDNVEIQFNGDTGNNYDVQSFLGNNTKTSANSSVAVSAGQTGVMPAANASLANAAGTFVIEIPNYANTSFNKAGFATTVSTDSTKGNNFVGLRGFAWRSTVAITSIKLFPQTSTNFVAGTHATLYGVH